MKSCNANIKKAAQPVGADVGDKLHSSTSTQLHCNVMSDSCQEVDKKAVPPRDVGQ